jgi:effector-binding domain-containing protein
MGKEQVLTRALQDPEVLVIAARRPQHILSIRGRVDLSRLTEAQGQRLTELWSFIHRHGVGAVGPPFVRYHTFGETETDLEVGIPVAEAESGDGRIMPGELPGGAAITTWHFGPHDRLGDSYARLQAWLDEHRRNADGAAWEVYWWIDPRREPDPAAWPAPSEWRTQVIQPIADA